MSYSEMKEQICKNVDKINEVIDDINVSNNAQNKLEKSFIKHVNSEHVGMISKEEQYRIGKIPGIEEGLREVSAGLETMANEIDSINDKITRFYLCDVGIKFDGTDESETLESILNSKKNITYIIPKNKTLIISRPININIIGVSIEGEESSRIKLIDKSNILTDCIEGKYNQVPALLNFFGNNSGVKNVIIDGNTINNYIECNGDKYHVFFYKNTIPNQLNSAGYNGIVLASDNCFCVGCTVCNLPWGGIAIKGYDVNWSFNGEKRKNCLIEKNIIKNCGRDAISIHYSSCASIKMNKIYDITWHHIHDYVECDNSIIQNNICENNIDNLIELYPGHLENYTNITAIVLDHWEYRSSEVTNSIVENNTIKGDIHNGIATSGFANSYKIINNNISSNLGNIGIDMSLSLGDCSVNLNKITNFKYGIVFAFNHDYVGVYPFTPNYEYENICNISISGNNLCDIDVHTVRISVKDYNDSQNLIKDIPLTYINISNNTTNKEFIDFICKGYNCENIKILETGNVSLSSFVAKTNYCDIFVDGFNGDDLNEGSAIKPFRTISRAISKAKDNIDIYNRIKLITDFTEDVVIDSINSLGLDKFIIEGWDINENSRKLRKVGSISITRSNKLELYNLIPNTTNDSCIFINATNYVRITDFDLTYTINSTAIKIMHNSNCIVRNTRIDNKNISFDCETLSRLYIGSFVEITNSPIVIKSTQGSIVSCENKIDDSKVVYNSGGVIFN